MAIIDIKLLPWFAICCQWLKQRGALWRIRWKFLLRTSARRRRRYYQRYAPRGPLWENMSSSTKPEVHNLIFEYSTVVRGQSSHGHR